MGHTPGPWKEYWNYLNILTIENKDHLICKMNMSNFGGHNEKLKRANAYLIAAAPDLLKACDRALAVIYDMRPSDKCQLENNAQLLLEQAIAKATDEITPAGQTVCG